MTKNERKNGSGKGSGGWKGFVTIPLSNTEDLGTLEAVAGELTTDELLLILAQEGYKVTLSELRDGSGFVVSCTGKAEDCPNRGFTTTTFAGSPRRGVLASWYKIVIKCDSGPWQEHELEGGLEI